MFQFTKVIACSTLVVFIVLNIFCIGTTDSQLRLGKAINIFVRYGYLSISMKVISYNDSETWLFKEPTRNVFRGLESLQENSLDNGSPGLFPGDFHLEFCDNKRQLFQAYFRDFKIEYLDRPWRAFTGGWHPEVAARKLGINASFITGEYCYVLVRVSRFHDSAKLKKPIPPNQVLEPDVAERIRNISTFDTPTAIQFMSNVGTHYIHSYITGDSLYQVFVYKKNNYKALKERLRSRGVNGVSQSDLYNYFAPWYAEHLGQIRSASGNSTIERWATRKLKLSYYLFTYASLIKLHGNGQLLRTVDHILGNEAILELELKAVSVIFKEPTKRKWFEEILDNYLKLWEVNM